ncbi:MAG: lipopolysaccharide assembly protein LapA domain-containing protein [Hyphomicrobium sp.]
MLKRLVTLLIAFPLGAALVAIAVSNRQPVQLVLDPFRPETPALAIELPFYVYLLGTLVLGVVLGGLATWLSQSRWRRTARVQLRRATRYEAETERLTRERDVTAQSASAASNASSAHLAIAGR